MASTALKEAEKKEFIDSLEELERKVETLAQWIRESQHTIAFTGAGISTSAGIPDFRSGMNTVLETGPGAWELRSKGQVRDTKKHKVTTTSKAIPTATHMTLVKLQQEGLLNCVISQNCDGLHRRSGLPTKALFELHGNSNVEKCSKCKREYLRDFCVRTAKGVFKHATGRLCDDPACRGKLKDTIINFGENLPEDALQAGFDHAEKAEVCLAMGSSLTVTPAADIPERVGQRKQRLVIVNLQRTNMDRLSALRIFAKTDDVAYLLMSKLGLEVPEFRLKRIIVLRTTRKSSGRVEVTVSGADQQGYPFSFLHKVVVASGKGVVECPQEPFVATVAVQKKVEVEVGFMGHYGEPPLTLPLRLDVPMEMVNISFNPFSREWAVERDNDTDEVTSKLEEATI